MFDDKNIKNNLPENKKTELKVKISMLKHNVIEMKREVDKTGENYKELNAKYIAAREIEELRNFNKNNLNEEVINCNKKSESLANVIKNLKLERKDLERENYYILQKREETTKEKMALLSYQDELTTKRQLLEKEIQLLRERYNNNEKTKMDNEIINSTSTKQFEYMSKEISDNNRKIQILQNKIEDLIADINKSEELLSLENCEMNSLSEFNQTIEKRVLTMKESVKINENKIYSIKREIENVKLYVDEAETERVGLNVKLETLIKIVTNLNNLNTKINTLLSFIIESLAKKSRFMSDERISLERASEMKNKILSMLKEINSYKEIVENY